MAIDNLNYYWKKKTIVSYILSILVTMLHSSAFSQYKTSADQLSFINSDLSLILQEAITRFAVPLFFIIAGATFFRNYSNSDYIHKVVRRIRSLLIPFLLWNVIYDLFAIITSYSFISNYFTGRTKFELSLYNIFHSLVYYWPNLVQWFVFDLMLFALISPLFSFLLKNKVTACCTLLIMVSLELFNVPIGNKILFQNNSVIFYFVGAIIGKYYFKWFSSKSEGWLNWGGYCLSFAICLILRLIEELNSLDVNGGIETILLCIMGISFWKAADSFTGRMHTKKKYDNSFIIYEMNVNVGACITKLLYLLIPVFPGVALTNFIVSVVLTVLSINIFCFLAKKYTPGLYKLLNGGRV